jgi:phosphatidylglycerophosphate synthase
LYPVKAAAASAALAAIVFVTFRRQRPRRPFGAANRLTLVRGLLTSMVAGFLGEPYAPSMAAAAMTLGAAATALDGVDGWVARRRGDASAYGARFDMEVDAGLILVLAALAWQFGKAGAWILLAGLLRYLFVAAGWVWRWMAAPLAPTYRAKLTCVVQIAGLLLAIAPFVGASLSRAIAAGTLALLTWSFAVDVRRLWRQAAP